MANNREIASWVSPGIKTKCFIEFDFIAFIIVKILITISSTFNFNQTLVSVILAALISSLTVGGKAIFKPIAIKNANDIIIRLAKFLSFFKRGK